MVAYQLIIRKKALEFINTLPSKSQRVVIEKCKTLAHDPFPGQGDKEIIHRKGHDDIYRLHISRSYTAFYKIYKNEKMVKILDITTIEQAHKIYGRFGEIFTGKVCGCIFDDIGSACAGDETQTACYRIIEQEIVSENIISNLS